MKTKQIINFLQENNIEFFKNQSFKNYCTYGVGGNIKLLILPFSVDELAKILNFLGETNYFVLGCGSKILPSDKAFKTPIIKLTGEFEGFQIKQTDNQTLLTVGAGVTVGKLINYCKINGLSNLEFLAGIPASMGGAVYMNAGTNVGEIKNFVVSVDTVVLENGKYVYKTFNLSECNFGYRTSAFQMLKCIIVSATFVVNKVEPVAVVENCKNILFMRSHQPKGKCCGSIFKKYFGVSAGELIDECGLKGLQYKQAKISEQHANFILNLKNAKAKHIKKLINFAEKTVQKQKGIKLTREVIYLEE